VLVLALSWYWRWRGNSLTPPRIASIAVLPLENLSGDSEQEFFADGMTDQLIADFSKIRSLRVTSRTSVMQYKKTRKRVPEIALELNADAVVEGSVVQSGDRVRINAKLIRAATDETLWVGTYERDLRDILALQSEVARAVARQINLTLSPQELAQLNDARSVDPQVYQLYLQGNVLSNQASSEQRLRQAIQYLEQAISKDPSFAPAHAALAESWFFLSSWYIHPREAMPKVRAAAQKALQLDNGLAEAHASMGLVHMFYDYDWTAAEKEFRRAIELNPSSVEGRQGLSRYFSAVERHDEAIAEVKKALEIDPRSLRIRWRAMFTHLLARRNDDAIEHARRALEIEPNFAMALAAQGLAYAEKRQFQEAVAHLEAAAHKERTPTMLGFLAHVKAAAGRRREAEKLVQDLESLATRRYICPYEVATAYASLGNRDRAFEYLHKGMDDRADCMAWLRAEPWMDSIRSDPRYNRLLEEVGLHPSQDAPSPAGASPQR
jgi:adenylate cyclase